jgi:uncharacterized protein
MRIWIDGDACPRDVKDVVYRAAQRTGTAVIVVANKAMHVPSTTTPVTMVQVRGGPDVADDHIAAEALRGDVVITHDVPLAARLVPSGVVVLDPRGYEYDAENIGERLSVRDFLSDARDYGMTTGGPAPFSARDKQRFASALDRALQRARR